MHNHNCKVAQGLSRRYRYIGFSTNRWHIFGACVIVTTIDSRSGQEDALVGVANFLAGHDDTCHVRTVAFVVGSPRPCTVVLIEQFFPLGLSRNAPYTAPVPGGSVVVGFQYFIVP